MDYTRLTLRDVRIALDDIARETASTFGGLDASQLNWRPAEAQWSIGQCFEHLLTANALTLRAAEHALSNAPSSIWQRVPLLPALFGPALIRSQAPETTRKYKAPTKARPPASEIPLDILERFAEQQRTVATWVGTLSEEKATSTIMVSPFIGFIAYSVADGARLLVAHDHRHFEQARRVLSASDFPRSPWRVEI